MTVISQGKAPAPPRLVAHLPGDFGAIFCPGCQIMHAFHLGPKPPEGTKPIPYNGRPTAPTFVGLLDTANASQFIDQVFVDHMSCSFVVTAGKIAFAKDCGHPLAGRTVALPPWPAGWWPGDKVPETAIDRQKMP